MYSKTAQFYDILYSFKDSRGVVLVEPWLTLDTFRTGMPHMAPPVDRPDLKIVRMNVSERIAKCVRFSQVPDWTSCMTLRDYLVVDLMLLPQQYNKRIGFFNAIK